MKRLILFELIIIFLATTFESDSPPGWFQQVLPVNDQITDIFFLDSLNGWVASRKAVNDTARVLYTSNGGTNWVIQYSYVGAIFNAIQFLNNNTGYAAGGDGFGRLFKTTNGGTNWNLFFSAGHLFDDLFFVNENTGWVCDDDATFGVGVLKTTNGGVNWQSQLGASFKPTKLFFINKDTGWVGTNEANGRLFRTTNSGVNWDLQYTISTAFISIFFINGRNGWIRAGGTNGVQYTTDGGFIWSNAQGTLAGYDIKFENDSVGISGSVPNIARSTDGGKTWGYQVTPPNTYLSVFALKGDTINGWAGTYNFIRTTDGGGTINYLGIQQTSSEIPTDYKLHQNYPNPFNPVTNIKYSVKHETSNVKLIIYDITGKHITELVNQKQQAGTYKVDWDSNNLPSGVYFYSLIINGITIDTKKMVLLK